MENHLENAFEQVKNGEEAGLNYIYTQTYNFVYLRAKSILKKEEDIHQLMKEVYLQMVTKADRIRKENLYEWLGKQTYILGCKKYRRKKVREADVIELNESTYTAQKSVDQESTCEIICDALENLPDMYQATFYAFYYDYMKIEDIAKVMDYSVGVILNRLNYTHKYMQKALEIYEEETKARVQFSLEAACATTRMWSLNNLMSETVAQAVYSGICRELNLSSGTIELEEQESAGANNTIVPHQADDMSVILEELEAYRSKPGISKKQIAIVAAAAVAFVILVLAIVLFAGKSDEEKTKDNQQVAEEQDKEPDEEDVQPDADADADENPDGETDAEADADTEGDAEADAESEYILPNSDTVKLTRGDLQGLSKEQLRLARNEVFARYGVIFGVEDLDNYFATKSWYRATMDLDTFNDTMEMNEIEEANLALIISVEDEIE